MCWRRLIALIGLIILLTVIVVASCNFPQSSISHDQQTSAPMRVGVHENYQGPDKTTLAETLSRFPQIDITREFEANPLPAQDLVHRITMRCAPIWIAGKSCAWSFKPLPADVAEHVKAAGLESKTVIVIWHEPENDVPKWFDSATDFVRYFNTVDRWLKSVDPSIVTSHAALGYRYARMTDTQAREWVTHATVQSIDLYSGRSFPLAMTLGTSAGFARWKASRPAGSRWGVSERGWIATPALSAERAASIRAEADWLAQLAPEDRPDYYIVWNTPGVERDPTIVLDEAGRMAVNAMFARLVPVASTLPSDAGSPGR
jgi:hypothetical protein